MYWNLWQLGFLTKIRNRDKIEEERMMLERAKALNDMSIYEDYIKQKGGAGLSSMDDWGGIGGPWIAHYRDQSEIANERMMLERAKAVGDMSIYENYVNQNNRQKKSLRYVDYVFWAIFIILGVIVGLFVLYMVKS